MKDNNKAEDNNTNTDTPNDEAQTNTPNKGNKNRKLGITLGVIAVCFFGFGFALVPLYNTFCSILGISTPAASATQNVEPISSSPVDVNKPARIIKVGFTSQIMDDTHVEFYAMQDKLEMPVKKHTTAKFFIHNKSNKKITFNTIYSLSPAQAGGNLHKIDCFCFREQTLEANEKREMPIVFYIDDHIDEYITNVNMNYALYNVDKKPKGVTPHSEMTQEEMKKMGMDHSDIKDMGADTMKKMDSHDMKGMKH